MAQVQQTFEKDPIQPHSTLGRDLIQSLLALFVPILKAMITMGGKMLEQV
jgi:hypothetical protein